VLLDVRQGAADILEAVRRAHHAGWSISAMVGAESLDANTATAFFRRVRIGRFSAIIRQQERYFDSFPRQLTRSCKRWYEMLPSAPYVGKTR
jgi:hypothetical protein